MSIGYTYVNIRMDDDGRMKVRAINAGYESVPTLVFPDGSTLTEPSEDALYTHLLDLGYRLDPLNLPQRLMVYFGNPILGAFGVGLVIGGWIAGSVAVMGVGLTLIAIPLLMRVLTRFTAKAG